MILMSLLLFVCIPPRRKGVTVVTCASAVRAADETPQFQSLPTADKANYGVQFCAEEQGLDLAPACKLSCQRSCEGTMERYIRKVEEASGLPFLEGLRKKMVRSCERQCDQECTRAGRASSFVVPSRSF